MAIGSVVDLIDYEKRTIEIAKKYGGGGGGTGDVSKSIIAPNWNKLTTYHYGDMVWYQDKLYACKLPVLAGDESNSNPDSNVTEWYQDVNVDFANTLNVKNENDYLKSKEIASEYDPTSTSAISVGSYRTHKTFNVSSGVYENVLYICTSPVGVTAGAFDETMWTEYLSYDPSNTYNTGDYATYEVDGTNKCFRCVEDNVTGEWDISKWTDVSETEFPSYNYENIYYPSVSKVALRYPGSYRYFIANATYHATGTIGEWDPLKWSDVKLAEKMPRLQVIQFATADSIETDANGIITHYANYGAINAHPLYATYTGMHAMGQTIYCELLTGSDNGTYGMVRVRLWTNDTENGGLKPMANVTAGSIKDMGAVTITILVNI